MHTSYTLRGTIRHPAMGAWLLKFNGKGNPIFLATSSLATAAGTRGRASLNRSSRLS